MVGNRAELINVWSISTGVDVWCIYSIMLYRERMICGKVSPKAWTHSFRILKTLHFAFVDECWILVLNVGPIICLCQASLSISEFTLLYVIQNSSRENRLYTAYPDLGMHFSSLVGEYSPLNWVGEHNTTVVFNLHCALRWQDAALTCVPENAISPR